MARFDLSDEEWAVSEPLFLKNGREAASLTIVADKAYGRRAIRQAITDEGAVAVISSRSNTCNPVPHAPGICAMRNLVERFFCRIRHLRRLLGRHVSLRDRTIQLDPSYSVE